MPWVRFDADTGKTVEETEKGVFYRASKSNEIFTLAVAEMSLSDRQKLLDLYYESTRGHDYVSTEFKPGDSPQTRGIKK